MALQLNPRDEAAHTAWRRSFKKLTHFATEMMELDQFYGLAADTFSSVDVARIGDVCYEAYVAVTLPGIMNAFQPAAAGTTYSSTTSCYEVVPSSMQAAYNQAYASGTGQAAADPDSRAPHFAYSLSARYCPLAPLALLKKVNLQVGSAIVDSLDSDVLNIWYSLTPKAQMWKENHFDFDSTETRVAYSMSASRSYVSLPFAFFISQEKGGNALSLITLAFHSVRFSVMPNSIDKIVQGYAKGDGVVKIADTDSAGAALNHTLCTYVRPNETAASALTSTTGKAYGHVSLASSAVSTSSLTALTSISQLSMNVIVGFAFLSDEERVLYSDASWETIITGFDVTSHQYGSGQTSNTIEIPFSHPTACLWVVAKSDHTDMAGASSGAVIAASTAAPSTSECRNSFGDYGGVLDPVTGMAQPAILGAGLELNSLRIHSGGPALGNGLLHESMYRTLIPMSVMPVPPAYLKSEAAKSGRKYILSWSFSLAPLDDPLQPTGFANFARVDKVSLKFALDPNLFTDLSGEQGENLASNKVTVKAIAFGYNLFRYVMGLGGKALV